ncbi:thymidylate synthase [Cytophagaceae bacterium DM2B3-1]|uniref:Thymidylate synthase n=1 Tax=Xanthocytophaga flava TaxID=3048013 RepID=A0ABT7CVU4_9BACT|nr:thymidylate synthase [Xanthocytophaga flavus]MDJ1497631.1 thymidylate synthase [Xanthocytophaga flavus]
MYISEATLDDLLYKVFTELLKLPFNVSPSRGSTSEILGAVLHLSNPRARLSRDEEKGTVFSALGELFWYLSRSNAVDFITYYIKRYVKEAEGNIIYGAYGPRLFNSLDHIDQIQNVISLLRDKPFTRRAVIQILEPKDLIDNHKEIPCTGSLQFFLRDNKLHMVTTMRSNDAYMGLPHDIFAFTMIQEIIARSLDVDLGEYRHFVASLHMYESNKVKAQAYLDAGFQSLLHPMPEMPSGDPWPAIRSMIKIEEKIREQDQGSDELDNYELNPYWTDFAYLFKSFSVLKKDTFTDEDKHTLESIKRAFSSITYRTYISKKIAEKLY